MRENQDHWPPVLYPESVVWIPEVETYGIIVGGLGAYCTKIYYVERGFEYEVWMENDEFVLLGWVDDE